LEIKKAKRKDLYKILAVDKTADERTIKKAYKRAAVMWHPDKHSASSEEDRLAAEAKFKEIGEAFSILSDAKKKQMFDEGYDLEEINQGCAGHGGGVDPNDMFRSFFGGRGGGGGGQ